MSHRPTVRVECTRSLWTPRHLAVTSVWLLSPTISPEVFCSEEPVTISCLQGEVGTGQWGGRAQLPGPCGSCSTQSLSSLGPPTWTQTPKAKMLCQVFHSGSVTSALVSSSQARAYLGRVVPAQPSPLEQASFVSCGIF